jgi:hypothetical protein
MTRLLLHDSLTTANLVEPLRRQWIDHEIEITFAPSVEAVAVGAEVYALLPSPEFTLLAGTHQIVPDVAVIDGPASAIAMRTPVRPDEIESSAVVLYETSATAELLARALIWPFFGITATDWTVEPAADAQITIVEGAAALQEPEAGHSLDLGRSWFVMTGMPVVTHVLAAPTGAPGEERERIVGLLKSALATSHERRRELRLLFDERYGVERERLVGYLSAQRYVLDDEAREALVALYVRGAGGSSYLPLTRPSLAGEEPSAD